MDIIKSSELDNSLTSHFKFFVCPVGSSEQGFLIELVFKGDFYPIQNGVEQLFQRGWREWTRFQ